MKLHQLHVKNVGNIASIVPMSCHAIPRSTNTLPWFVHDSMKQSDVTFDKHGKTKMFYFVYFTSKSRLGKNFPFLTDKRVVDLFFALQLQEYEV
jgi:hypothetical protein